jgi:hypothetical protein
LHLQGVTRARERLFLSYPRVLDDWVIEDQDGCKQRVRGAILRPPALSLPPESERLPARSLLEDDGGPVLVRTVLPRSAGEEEVRAQVGRRQRPWVDDP